MSGVTMLSLNMMTTVLSQNGPQQTGPDFGKASPVGLIIVVLLLIAVFFLVWSMNKHLRRLPKSFDADDDGAAAVKDPSRADNPADGTKRDSP